MNDCHSPIGLDRKHGRVRTRSSEGVTPANGLAKVCLKGTRAVRSRTIRPSINNFKRVRAAAPLIARRSGVIAGPATSLARPRQALTRRAAGVPPLSGGTKDH